MNAVWTADERLYLNRAGEVRHDGDPDVATLLCGVGTEVPDATCHRYKIGPYADLGKPVAVAEGESLLGVQSDTAVADPPQNKPQGDPVAPPDPMPQPDGSAKPRRRR